MGCLHSSDADALVTVVDREDHKQSTNQIDPIRLTILGTGNSGKTTVIKSLINTEYQWYPMAAKLVEDHMPHAIGTVILSFLPRLLFPIEECEKSRPAIRQNCVARILTILQKSQQLYESDSISNAAYLIERRDQIVEATQLVVNYSSESFTDELDYQEMKRLGLSY